MNTLRWSALGLLLLAAGLWFFSRDSELVPAAIDAPLEEKRIATPTEETLADSRRPIDNAAVPSSPATPVPSSSIDARVIDPSGAVVTGAEVWFSDGLIDELQGESDSEGLVHCARAHWKSSVSERAGLTAY
ncbi:MAG: hypothetical protein ABIP42_13285, partial [Planctomycetota bacterium]